MANWQTKMDFSDAKKKYENSEIGIRELAKNVVKEIYRILPEVNQIDPDLGEELINEVLPAFEDFEIDNSLTVDDFDNALYDLYNWADTPLDMHWAGRKMCWVVP